MAATARALVQDERLARPELRVVPEPGERQDRRRVAARRRLVALAIITVVAFGAGLLAASPPSRGGAGDFAAGTTPAQPRPAAVVVAPGDTVWELARDHLPEGVSAGDYMAEILATNDIDPAALQPGTVIRLPPP